MSTGRLFLCGLLAAILFAAATYPSHWASLQSGRLFDVDSLMRLVEVRDLLDGRGWYDPVQARTTRPGGVAMHWSRLVDGPVAGLIWLTRLFTGPQAAEQIGLALWPFAMLVAYFCLQARIAMRLAGRAALLPALVIAATAHWTTLNFLIGNIDHHNLAIVLVLGLLALAPALATDRRAAAAAGVIAVMVPAVAIDGVPYAAAFLLWVSLCWVFDPGRMRVTINTFFAAVAIAAAVFLILLAGPARIMETACDAYSLPHASVLAAGGIGMLAAIRLVGAQGHPIRRLAATVPVAAFATAALALTGRDCFGGPYHMITPELQALWLDLIIDAGSLVAVFGDAPVLYACLLIAPLVALGAAVRFTWTAPREDRADWWLILAMLAAGLATMAVQLRGLMFAGAFAVPACAALVTRLRPHDAGASASPGPGRYAAWIGAWLGSLAILHYDLVADSAGSGTMPRAVPAPRGEGLEAIVDTDCMRASSHFELAAMAPAPVVSLPGLGVPVLLHTRHRIAAATFHRFGDDIVDMVHLFAEADPDVFADRYAGALLAVCLTSRESRIYAAAAPSGLISRLMAGDPPAWLVPASVRRDTALRIYRIKP